MCLQDLEDLVDQLGRGLCCLHRQGLQDRRDLEYLVDLVDQLQYYQHRQDRRGLGVRLPRRGLADLVDLEDQLERPAIELLYL